MSRFDQITVDTSDGVSLLTLHRADAGNAYTPIMRREIVEALDEIDADDSVRAVVITGHGRHFCVGADLAGNSGAKPFSYEGTGQRDDKSRAAETISGVPRDGGGVVSLRLAAMRKPTIAAINGAAVGVGATITLPMDIRIASSSARFGFVFTRRGIMPEAASSWFLPRVVGISRAMEWVATGRIINAADALAAGLVSQVVPGEELIDAAMEIAREIRDNTSSISVAISRQMLWGSLSESSPWWAHERESVVMSELKFGPDAAEGVASFFEKRPPVFPSSVSTDYPATAPNWPQRPTEYSD
ncbi:enoyl-CoA hydratase-related protein [Microbacterium profundi]|uniref:Enoyl-CoA hydratase-related protein n=1 Tax=Microbacterium profundi TaxID=450380 RepID=A0ABV3LD96_9MICO